jgi:hypothetical protein
MESVNHVSDYVNKTLKFVNSNKIMNSVVAIFLILYAVLAAPKLPKSVAKVFDYTLVKLVYMFLIAYLATKNPSVAIISAATLLITIQTLSSYDTADKIVDAVQSNNVVAVETRSDVPLSPARAELVEESTKKANEHKEAANRAAQVGDNETAKAHTDAATIQEIKVDSAIKAKIHKLKADDAEEKGNTTLVQVHKEAASKHDDKVKTLADAEKAKVAASKAEQEGNYQEAQQLLKEAELKEKTVKLRCKSETKRMQAREAQIKGDVNKADKLEAKADKLDEKAAALVLEPEQNDVYASVEPTTETETENETKVELEKHNHVVGNIVENDLSGYESGTYADVNFN